jgi:hypothetical protein
MACFMIDLRLRTNHPDASAPQIEVDALKKSPARPIASFLSQPGNCGGS